MCRGGYDFLGGKMLDRMGIEIELSVCGGSGMAMAAVSNGEKIENMVNEASASKGAVLTLIGLTI